MASRITSLFDAADMKGGMPAYLLDKIAKYPAQGNPVRSPVQPQQSPAAGPGTMIPGIGMVPNSILPKRGGNQIWSPGAYEAEIARRMGMSNWKNLPGSAAFRGTSSGRGGSGADASGMSGNGLGGFGFGPAAMSAPVGRPSQFSPGPSLTALGGPGRGAQPASLTSLSTGMGGMRSPSAPSGWGNLSNIISQMAPMGLFSDLMR